MLDLTDEQADREELRARRMAWIDTSAGVRFSHGSHREDVIARLDADPALRRALHARAFAALTERVPAAVDPDSSLPVRIAEHALARRPGPVTGGGGACLPRGGPAERASGEAAETWARAGIAQTAGYGDAGQPAPGARRRARPARRDTAADREYQLAYDIAADRPLAGPRR